MDILFISSSFAFANWIPIFTVISGGSSSSVSRDQSFIEHSAFVTTTGTSVIDKSLSSSTSRAKKKPQTCPKEEQKDSYNAIYPVNRIRQRERLAIKLFRIILFESLLLFSLAILEILLTKKSVFRWCLFLIPELNRDGPSNDRTTLLDSIFIFRNLSMTTAYTWILWIDCFSILMVPILVIIGPKIYGHPSNTRRYFRILYFPFQIIIILFQVFFRLIQLVIRVLRKILVLRTNRSSTKDFPSLELPMSMTTTHTATIITTQKTRHNTMDTKESMTKNSFSPCRFHCCCHSYYLFVFSWLFFSVLVVRVSRTYHLGRLYHKIRRAISSMFLLHETNPKVSFDEPMNNNLWNLVSKLCFLGLLQSSMMDGFGSILFVYNTLSGFFLTHVSKEDVIRAEEEYLSICRILQEKEDEYLRQIQEYRLLQNNNSHDTDSTPSSLEDRPWFFGIKKRRTVQPKTVISWNEIETLRALAADLQYDVDEMVQIHKSTLDVQTFRGKVKCLIGFVFSLILLIRLCMAFYTLFITSSLQHKIEVGQHQPVESPRIRRDPISTILFWFSAHDVITENEYSTLCDLVSLVLSVFLSTTQVRSFIRVVNIVTSRVRQCCCISPDHDPSKVHCQDTTAQAGSKTNVFMGEDIFISFLASLMGCYFLSCVTLIKRGLAEQYQSSFIRSMGGKSLELNHRATALMFTWSAVLGALLLGIVFGFKKLASNRTIERFSDVHEKV